MVAGHSAWYDSQMAIRVYSYRKKYFNSVWRKQKKGILKLLSYFMSLIFFFFLQINKAKWYGEKQKVFFWFGRALNGITMVDWKDIYIYFFFGMETGKEFRDGGMGRVKRIPLSVFIVICSIRLLNKYSYCAF